MSKLFSVKGTDDRKNLKNHYLICVNKKMKNKLKLGKFAVVSFQPKNHKKLYAYGIIKVNNDLKNDEVMLDQTLRVSIGISYNNDDFAGFTEKVELNPIKVNWYIRIKKRLSSIFGVRYLFCRFNVLNITDAEKKLIRLSSDALDLLGIKNGDTVICEYPTKINDNFILKTYKVQAYIAPENMIQERYRIENDDNDSNNERYQSSEKLLGLKPDIPRIFIDWQIRVFLGTDELQPISVRRDVKGLFFNQIRDFGVMLMLTMLATVSVIPGDNSVMKLTIMGSFCLLFSVVITLLNIRSTLK